LFTLTVSANVLREFTKVAHCASGDVSLGLGFGANVLVGGSCRTIALQPLSIEGQVGINLALGAARSTLR
jgi:Protein of unknown function (DUF992)